MQLFRKGNQRSPSLGDAENLKYANIPDADIDTHKYAYVPRFEDVPTTKFRTPLAESKLRTRPDRLPFSPSPHTSVSSHGHVISGSDDHNIDDQDEELYFDPGPPSPNPLVRSNTIATTGSTGSGSGREKDIILEGPYIRYRILRPSRLSSLRVIVEDFDSEKHAAALINREKFFSHEATSPPSTATGKKKEKPDRDVKSKSTSEKGKGKNENAIVPYMPEEAFRCEYNAFHPRKYPLVLKSPERHTLGVARFRPFNVTGVQAEITIGGDTRSGARFETVGFERRSSRGGSEPGKGWRWLRGPAVKSLQPHWRSGSMKLEDEWGQVVAVMLRDTGGGGFVGLLDNREEGIFFVRVDVKGEDLDWVILSGLAIYQAWKRTRRDTAGSFAAGAGRGATMAV